MTAGVVLDPTLKVAPVKNPKGPPVGSLAGKVVGFRRDIYWLSWEAVVDEWSDLVERDGAVPMSWRHTPPVGKEAESLLAELDQFIEQSDVSIIGLANCGACTMWTIHDALRSLRRDHPTVIVSTEHFADLARALAEREGRPEVRLLTVPHPLEGRPEPEVRQIARDYYPKLLSVLEATI